MHSAAEAPAAAPRRRTDLKRIPPRASLGYTERFSKERLDAFRLRGDPPADAVVAALHEHHGGLTNIHDLLTKVQQLAAKEPGERGDVFRGFLASIAEVPAWAEPGRIERGQRLQAVHLPFMGLSLFCGSLVGGAMYSTAAAVTALAGNITTDPTRRIRETGMLLGALAFPGTLLRPGGAAHDSLTRVRLLHAALRHWLPRSGRLQQHRGMVPAEVYVEGEVPLNQQDLAITLGVFCYINLRSLRRMGVVLSSSDITAYVQMWRYAGYVLGIEDELLPASLEDQEEFMMCSMIHQGSPDTIDGDKVKKFIDAFAMQANQEAHLPFGVVQTYLYQMTRYLNGNDYTTGMGFEDLGDGHWSVRLTRLAGYTFGTLLPRLPLGETALASLHSNRLKAQLLKRGTPTGHAAGSGQLSSRL